LRTRPSASFAASASTRRTSRGRPAAWGFTFSKPARVNARRGSSTTEREVRSRCQSNDPHASPDAFAAPQSASVHAQRAYRWPGELEQRRRARVQIGIDVPHLRAHVTAAAAESARGLATSVEPAQPGEADRSGVATEQKRRVRRSRHRRKCGRDGRIGPFGAKSRERGQGSIVHCPGKGVRTRSIGEQDNDGHKHGGAGDATRPALAGGSRFAVHQPCERDPKKWRRLS
jgi:hypothetical protein